MPDKERPVPTVIGNGAAISASEELLQNIATGAEAQAPAQPNTWRAHLRVHPAASILPLLSPAELQELAHDIEKNGLQHRVAIYHDGEVEYLLDGRNRLDALQLLGVSIFDKRGRRELDYFEDVGQVWPPVPHTDFDPFSYVISTNVRRRHLTAEQKRDVIAKLLKAKPEQSNRQTAKLVGVDDKTVGKVRVELEATAEIPQLNKTTGADGKVRPAKKKLPEPISHVALIDGSAEVMAPSEESEKLQLLDDAEPDDHEIDRTNRKRPPGRSARWADAVSRAIAALEELHEIQGDYQDWLGNLPENLANSPVAEKLQTVIDIDIASAIEIVTEAESADLPLGFGRD